MTNFAEARLDQQVLIGNSTAARSPGLASGNQARQQFLTERELAATLKCSRPAIRKWRKDGLPCYRFGRLVRFDLATVLLWFEKRRACLSLTAISHPEEDRL
jgi:excisionase family DNA binding protein